LSWWRRSEVEAQIRLRYFFDEFDSGHFGAWDTDLAIEVDDFVRVISTCRSKLQEYAKHAQNVLDQGRSAYATQS
jgi:hypothetical protein